jgi:hypothetical protein
MFRVGQKVVCVWGARMRCPSASCRNSEVVTGQVYTIRGFEDGGGVLVEEVRPVPHTDGECSWRPERFRPVVDISDLEAIVREQMLGRPRVIEPDKFDKQRIHSAVPHGRHDCAVPPTAPVSRSGECDSSCPNSAAAGIR